MWNLKRSYWWIYFQGSNEEKTVENRPINTGGGEKEEGEMCGESDMELYNVTCKIDSQWEFALWLRELKQRLCDNLEG